MSELFITGPSFYEVLSPCVTTLLSFPFTLLRRGNIANFQEIHHTKMTVSNTIFTVFSGLGLVLSLIPLWWHLKSRSVGTSMFMIWTALACLAHFVDSIIWNGNAINWAPVWCDISTFKMPLLNPHISQVSRRYSYSTRRRHCISCLWSLHPSPSLLYQLQLHFQNNLG